MKKFLWGALLCALLSTPTAHVCSDPTPASVSTLGPKLPRNSIRQAWIGDSREAIFAPQEGKGEYRIQSRSYGAWAEALSGCHLLFDYRYAWGWSGQTAQYEWSQYGSSVAQHYNDFDMLFIESPANNVDGTSNFLADDGAIASVKAMAHAALSHEKTVTLMGMQAGIGWSANQLKQVAQYNRWAAGYANSTPGVFFVSVFPDLTDATGSPIAADYVDGLHVNGAGAVIIARNIVNTLSPLTANPRLPTAAASESYDATLAPFGNLLPNPQMTGTGGTKAGAGGIAGLVTGNVPTSWDISHIDGTGGTFTLSQAAKTSGYGSVNSSLTATVAINGESGVNDEAYLFQNVTTAARGAALAQGSLMVDYTGLSGFSRLQLVAFPFGGVTQQWTEFEDAPGANVLPLPASGSLCLRTPAFPLPAGTTNINLQVLFSFNPSGNGGSAGGTLTFHDPSLNYLN
jgi:hypothetical protein